MHFDEGKNPWEITKVYISFPIGDCGKKFWLVKFTFILIVDTTNATNYWKYIEFRMEKLSTSFEDK